MESTKQFSSDKILKHLRRVCNWVDGNNVPPITVELDMTNICTHKCPECVVGYYQRKDSTAMSKELSGSIIDQLADFLVKGLIFTGGGDPLCNTHTPDAIAKAKQRGLDVGLITNGGLLNEDNVDILINNCSWIRVSLDASNSDEYRATHGMGSTEFYKVLKNIELLAHRKRELGSTCTIGVGYLTSKDTCSSDSFESAVCICEVIGVDYIQFRPMQIHNRGKFEYNWLNITDKIEACFKHNDDNFSVLYSKHKYDMMKQKDFGRDYKVCHGHQFASTICADGKVYICCHLRDYEKYCIGNLKKDSFKKIWNSEYRKDVYKKIDFKDCIPLCRCNTFNQVLWNLKQEQEHVNFL